MNKKERYIHSYLNEQNERSKQYIVVSGAMLGLMVIGIKLLPNFLPINDAIYNLMVYSMFILFVALSVYWYLAIKPSKYIYNEVISTIPKPMSRTERLTRINEIFEAIKLYEHYILYPENTNDLSELESFISKRRDIFPLHHEFGSKSDKELSFSSEVNRKLFMTALFSVQNQLKAEDEALSKQPSIIKEEKPSSLQNDTDIIALTKTFTNRLKNEIEQLTKGANIYITFGSTITVGAAMILFYTVSDLSNYFTIPNSEIKPVMSASDWFSVISRFSIVIFVEVFAFYYLRLYRSTMDTVKYYQNEITNIEMRLMAVHSLKTLANPDSTSANVLITSLANSERNFVIEKGQTTVDLEKQKNESNQINSMFDGITKLTKVVRR